jgi:hypothetical protein
MMFGPLDASCMYYYWHSLGAVSLVRLAIKLYYLYVELFLLSRAIISYVEGRILVVCMPER